MKKVFAALLMVAILLGLASCAGTPNTPGSDTSKNPGSSSVTPNGDKSGTPDPGPQDPGPQDPGPQDPGPQDPNPPAALEGVQRIIVLNNAFDGLSTSSQCYNAKEYHKAYSLGEFIDSNFWYAPAEDTKVQTVAYTDFYSDESNLATFRGKYISFQEDNPEFDYDLFVGPMQKESADVKFKGYCVVDKEVILLMQEDGWNMEELFEYVSMVDADSYDFICADGWTQAIEKADLKDTEIVYSGERVDCTFPGGEALRDIRYVVPADWTKDTDVSGVEGVCKINVALNGEGVYKTDAPYTENRAGTFYDSWSVSELLSKHSVAKSDTVKIVSYKDGFTMEDSYDLFAQKYIAYQGPNEKGDNKDYFTLGKAQPRNEGVTNTGYYILSEDAFAFIPADGVSVSDIFTATGMAQAAQYELTYTDGRTEQKSADEVGTMTLAQDGGLLYIKAIAG